MKIVEDSPTMLRLRDRTLWISVLCLATAAFLAYRVLAFHAHPNNLFSVAFLSLFGLAFLEMANVQFDKIRGVCTLRVLRILRLTRTSLSFADISDVRVEVAPLVGASTSTNCRLSLMTKSGVIPLTSSYEPGFERYERMREAIFSALGRAGARPAAVDPVEVLVRAGRIVDAISLLRKRENVDLATARDRVTAMERRLVRG